MSVITIKRHTLDTAGALAATLVVSATLLAQKAAPVSSAASLPPVIDDAVKYQLEDFQHKDWAVRYRVHRVDSKEESLRDLIESTDGNVARTLEKNGERLSPEQEAAEQQRLRQLTREELSRHRHRSDPSDHYGVELLKAMPEAMKYTLVPDQPQLSKFSAAQVVVDYEPRADFKPATAVQSLLAGLAGRLWIDAATHHLLRIDIRITKNLNLAFGLLARVYQGGTMSYEQVPLANGHDAYSHIEINVVLRELMVKTVPYHSTLDVSDIQLLRGVPTLPEAVDLLLPAGAAR